MTSHSVEPGDRVQALGTLMRVDAVTAEVVRDLGSMGVPTILLKGPSIGRWIYEERTGRLYADTDLLVRPDDLPRVQERLSELGFVLGAPRHELDRPVPSANWYRPHGGAAVDVHVSITGIGVPPAAAWEVLSRDTETMVVGGAEVDVASKPARALHIGLHAAQHGALERRPLDDLDVALRRLDDDLWRRAAALAEELDACEAFAAGLRLRPDGAALAARLGLPAEAAVDVLLRRETAPPLALSIHWLTAMPGILPKVRLVASKLFPRPAEMRIRARLRGRDHLAGVAWEYARNVLVLLRHVPPALVALRRARAAANGRRNPRPRA